MHDLGLAAWFGGSLMGAVGLNGAAAQAANPQERAALAATGWKRWAPVNAAAIAAHVAGGIGLLTGNRRRLKHQKEGRANTIAKTALTGAALGMTAYGGYLGRQVQRHSGEGAHGATEPRDDASPELAKAQKQLRATQWAIPALTAVLVALGSHQGEQQRPIAGLMNR